MFHAIPKTCPFAICCALPQFTHLNMLYLLSVSRMANSEKVMQKAKIHDE
jgi:hypothetical protein